MSVENINPKSKSIEEKQAFLNCLPDACLPHENAFRDFKGSIEEYFLMSNKGWLALKWCIGRLGERTPFWLADLAYKSGRSDCVAQYCPKFFDPSRFDWRKFSWAVLDYCPEHFDAKLFPWKHWDWYVELYHTEFLKFKPQQS